MKQLECYANREEGFGQNTLQDSVRGSHFCVLSSRTLPTSLPKCALMSVFSKNSGFENRSGHPYISGTYCVQNANYMSARDPMVFTV